MIVSAFVLLLVSASQTVTSTNQTSHINPDVTEFQYNVTSRRSGRIIFDDTGISGNENQDNSGLVKFDDDVIEESPKLPFRFENKPPRGNSDDLNDASVNYNDVQAPGYGIHKPDLLEPGGYGLQFQDDNRIEGNQVNAGQKKRKKRRRRRRKPRFQKLTGQGYGLAQQDGLLPGQGDPNGLFQGGPHPGPFGPFHGSVPYLSRPYPDPSNPGRPIYPEPLLGGQFYRPPRRPRPSIAEEALTSVTSALTSIARYDDFQCVPRLLCEVAGGRAPATGGGGVLQSIVNLQPLVTLLAAYNGVTTSPLFVFGRAVFLGMTSKGNAGTCRYAYPQCPTDPEKLVDYLNNHNGGFFRFFNAPNQYPDPGQQNLEQFYSHLSNMQLYNYGLYPNGLQDPNQQGYGFPVDGIQPGYGFQNGNQNYGYGFQNGSPLNYGNGYPYNNNDYGFQNPVNYKSAGNNDTTIEKRIQNKPDVTYVDNFESKRVIQSNGEANNLILYNIMTYNHHSYNESKDNNKWSFPNNSRFKIDSNHQGHQFTLNTDKQRFGRTIKFPEKDVMNSKIISMFDSVDKKAKGFNFPEAQSNRQYIDYYDYPPFTKVFDNNNFKLDEDGYYVESNDNDAIFNQYNDEDGKGSDEKAEVVYVLRGNSDPNHPEVIKLKPGQKL